MALLAGLDLGTTSIKAVLYDADLGQVVASASRPTPLDHPFSGANEHDPEALWQACCDCLRGAVGGKQVRALAISSMAEAGLPVDTQGKPLAHAIAWFDRRSSPQAARVEEQIGRARLYQITGQRASASFGLTKWLWLREHEPEITSRFAAWLPLPAYILLRLTGQRAVDYSIASRALLLEQTRLDWSPELLEIAGLSADQLPSLANGGTPLGTLTASAAAEIGLPAKTLCVLGGHDHLCASFAAGAIREGDAVDSTGTAEALVRVLPEFLPDPALGERGFACYAHVLGGKYVLKGGLKSAGSSIQWLAQLLSPPGEEADYARLEAGACEGVGRISGPLWLPHLLESGSPEADPLSRGALVGARLEHSRADLFRGLLEGLACWLRRNLEEMQAFTGQPVETLTLLGGTTRLRLLSELKADLLGSPVRVSEIPEAAAVGAALLAGLGSGVFTSPAQAVESLQYGSTIIEPDAQRAAWYERIYQDVYLPLYPALKDIQHRF